MVRGGRQRLERYGSGGYLLAKAQERWDYLSPDLIPDTLVSASRCIVWHVPDAWALEWASYEEEERRAEALGFGIVPEALPEVMEWTTARFDEGDIRWPGVFRTVPAATQFADSFLPLQEDTSLIGMGLAEDLVEEFLSGEAPGGTSSGSGELVRQHEGLQEDGEVLGYEVLDSEFGSFHSWLCNGLERDVSEALGIRPNDNGFIENAEEARSCAEYAAREEVEAEPVDWLPWLIVRYPLPERAFQREER